MLQEYWHLPVWERLATSQSLSSNRSYSYLRDHRPRAGTLFYLDLPWLGGWELSESKSPSEWKICIYMWSLLIAGISSVNCLFKRFAQFSVRVFAFIILQKFFYIRFIPLVQKSALLHSCWHSVEYIFLICQFNNLKGHFEVCLCLFAC